MLRKLSFTSWSFFIFLFIQSSCGTTRVNYQVAYPAEIALPKNSTIKLGMITWFDSTRFIPGNKTDRVIVESYYFFTEALTNKLQGIDNLLLVTPSIKLERLQTQETPPDIAADEVIEKCERMGSDYFIVIEDFRITRHKSLVLFNDGEQSKSVQTAVTLTLYSKSGDRIDRSDLIQSHEVSSEATNGFLEGLISLKPSIRQNADLLIQQSEAIVEEYVQKFHPFTKHVHQAAFSKNEFQNFVMYFNLREFEAAENLLIPLTENSNRKIARRAMYNMYILREAEGKPEEAHLWLKKYIAFINYYQ